MEKLFSECKSQGGQQGQEMDNYLKLQRKHNPGGNFAQMMQSHKPGNGQGKGRAWEWEQGRKAVPAMR